MISSNDKRKVWSSWIKCTFLSIFEFESKFCPKESSSSAGNIMTFFIHSFIRWFMIHSCGQSMRRVPLKLFHVGYWIQSNSCVFAFRCFLSVPFDEILIPKKHNEKNRMLYVDTTCFPLKMVEMKKHNQHWYRTPPLFHLWCNVCFSGVMATFVVWMCQSSTSCVRQYVWEQAIFSFKTISINSVFVKHILFEWTFKFYSALFYRYFALFGFWS